MTHEITAALTSLQEWANAHPEHAKVLVGKRHTCANSGQQALDCGLNYFGAQLLAESFWERQKTQDMDSVTIRVSPTRTGMPAMWVIGTSRPMGFPELACALSPPTPAPAREE